MRLSVRTLVAIILVVVVGLWLALRVYQQKTIDSFRESIATLTIEALRDSQEVSELSTTLKDYNGLWGQVSEDPTLGQRRALRMSRQRFEFILRKMGRPDLDVLAKLYFEQTQNALGDHLMAGREQRISQLYEQLLGGAVGLEEASRAKVDELQERGASILKREREADVIFLVVSFVALVSLIGILWALVGAPLTQLAVGVRRLAREEWDKPLPVKGFGEIADLIRAFNRMAHVIERQKELLVKEATTDELTGLLNFRAFRERSQEELDRSHRLGKPLSLILADIDFFKKYNDTRGHIAGNHALKEIALRLRKGCRRYDLVARFGGEEFAIILPETDKEKAAKLAERIRKLVASDGFTLTLSCGVASFPHEAKDLESLIAEADKRLYRAKAEGRNRVVAA